MDGPTSLRKHHFPPLVRTLPVSWVEASSRPLTRTTSDLRPGGRMPAFSRPARASGAGSTP
eukprot:scaffold626_cov337-Pavlova_lutheri.AAC.30